MSELADPSSPLSFLLYFLPPCLLYSLLKSSAPLTLRFTGLVPNVLHVSHARLTARQLIREGPIDSRTCTPTNLFAQNLLPTRSDRSKRSPEPAISQIHMAQNPFHQPRSVSEAFSQRSDLPLALPNFDAIMSTRYTTNRRTTSPWLRSYS